MTAAEISVLEMQMHRYETQRWKARNSRFDLLSDFCKGVMLTVGYIAYAATVIVFTFVFAGWLGR